MRCWWWDWRAGAPAPHFRATSGFDFFDGVGLGDVEFGDGGAAEGCEVGSAAEALAHFVGDRAHVGSGGDAGAEVGAVVLDGGDGKFFYFDLNRLQHDFFLFAGEFVGGDAVDFFRGERWRGLLDCAVEFGGEGLQTVESEVGPAARWTAPSTTLRAGLGGCPHMSCGGISSPNMI